MKRLLAVLAALAAVLVAGHLALRPPSLEGRSQSSAVAASPETRLGRLAVAPPQAGPGTSGVMELLDGPDAFAARVALIRAAERALDVQYYIWHRDTTGMILLDELRQAAARGVRVRLLLDDNGIAGLDRDLAALDALPNFEVRLFNPFILRRPKALNYLFDFVRLNRRMHNKALTADGALSILGGRNIGDPYFSFGNGIHYRDTDVLVAGPVAADIGADFDRYWASLSAHPAARILPAPDAGALDALGAETAAAAGSDAGRRYLARLGQTGVAQAIRSGGPALDWTRVTLVSDDPAKGVGRAQVDNLLFPQLMALLARPEHSVDLVSAYLVPGRSFAERLAALARSGVRVRILTNSQAATDVFIVHSRYVRYRPQLLQAGVELCELEPGPAGDPDARRPGSPGASRASLHAKTLAVDGRRMFVGSFNFDPRSLALNTEMGVLIDSPALAGGLARAFDDTFPAVSYRPHLQDGRLVWTETLPDGSQRQLAQEPDTTALTRLALSLIGRLPIEWLL